PSLWPEFGPTLKSSLPDPPWRRPDIARPGTDQPAIAQLFARMGDPSDAARHRKQCQFVAGRQVQPIYQHRQRVVDVDEFAGGLADAPRNFPGELRSRRAPTLPTMRARADPPSCKRRGRSPQTV